MRVCSRARADVELSDAADVLEAEGGEQDHGGEPGGEAVPVAGEPAVEQGDEGYSGESRAGAGPSSLTPKSLKKMAVIQSIRGGFSSQGWPFQKGTSQPWESISRETPA